MFSNKNYICGSITLAAIVGTFGLIWFNKNGTKIQDAKLKIPIINLSTILLHKKNGDFTERGDKECDKVIDCLHRFGILIVKDPRISQFDNDTFLDMMEFYFEQEDEKKMEDVRPKIHYQVGATPEKTEKPRPHCRETKHMNDSNKPVTICPPEKDAKWRFFWRIGERPTETSFKELNSEPVIPEAFKKHWGHVMNNWGENLLQTVLDITEAVSHGLHLPQDFLKHKMTHGPHLLAPTGTNLDKFGKENTVMAGYHADLNFITCHGKSRYPGLYIWLRDGTRKEITIPDGCLLLQAGKQLEYLTGGWCMAGFHEVIVSNKTRVVIEKRKAENKSLWRVSSTLFSHLRSDEWLEPLPQFKNNAYPRTKVGDFVTKELQSINL